MIKFAVLSIVGIMPMVNLHQWDTQLENIVLPLLSDMILFIRVIFPYFGGSSLYFANL